MSYLEILGMIGLGLGCGLSKLGIPAALVFSPILASVYGGKASAGIIIIPVIVSDLIVMYLYRKDVEKKVLFKSYTTLNWEEIIYFKKETSYFS